MAEGLGAEGLEDGEFRGRALCTDGHWGAFVKVFLYTMLLSTCRNSCTRLEGASCAILLTYLSETQRHADTRMHENEIGTIIVDMAVNLHRDLGPGLLERVYEIVLAERLRNKGLLVLRQVPISIEFDGLVFDEGFRADLIVEHKVIIELKSVEAIHPAHKKQVLTYLRLTGLKLGYLLNFGASVMKNGISRTINGEL